MGTIENLTNYWAEHKIWKDAGEPIRDLDTMAEIHSICSTCPLFEKDAGWLPGYDRCGKCHCNLHPTSKTLNKIAWGTTKCPDTPPKW